MSSELKLTCENRPKSASLGAAPARQVEFNGVAIYGPGWDLAYAKIDAAADRLGVDREKAHEAARKLTEAWAAKGIEVSDPAAKFEEALERLKARPARALAAYNDAAARYGFPKALKLTPARSTKIGARINEVGWDQFLAALDRAGQSSFCRGDNQNGWRLDFDFLCQAGALLKILEGRYDDRTAPSRPPGGPPQKGVPGMSESAFEARKKEMMERYGL